MYWLPPASFSADEFRAAVQANPPDWSLLSRLAQTRLDFVQTQRIDRAAQKLATAPAADIPAKALRLAVLGSSTTDHLVPGLRVAAMRRGIRLETHLGDYGQYIQELHDPDSALNRFRPNVILFAFHARHLLGSVDPALSNADAAALIQAVAERLRALWRLAKTRCSGQIIQQSLLPTPPSLVGGNEHRLPGSAAALIERLNVQLRALADEEGVDLLALDRSIQRDGLAAWHDPVLWHRAKQEISPTAAPAYGELALRLIAAQQGRSAKCLVLDLDNTLWGGVIGDDGLDGIRLGQGSALGEAYVAFQDYVRDLARRGVILAVCSKNDPENARAPFDKHPDMVLKAGDVACFVANWTDKASNIRHIAEQLNIGIDSLVFVDDNPFERNIVRRELPMVAVLELPEDPALYAQCIADAGYFEALHVTPDDFERTAQYRANIGRETLRASHTDLAGYLQSLNMELRWAPFDRLGLQRIVQLINKTNQFNLTTRRYSEQDVIAAMEAAGGLTLQLRLLDQFGDNGIIGIIIGQRDGNALRLDIWLMSCRVLGRQVEEATLNLVASEAAKLGASRLVGDYLPTQKNGMVRDHYQKLGFAPVDATPDGSSRWALDLANYKPLSTFISTTRMPASE
jgi:FkbH-like protein